MENIMDNRTVSIERAKYDVIIKNAKVHKGKAVYCITTGEYFRSAREAAEHYDISYGSLILHLNGKHDTCGSGTGYKKQWLQFCYIADLATALPAISKQTIEMKQNGLSKEDVARLRKEINDLKEEIKEKDNKIAAQAITINDYKAKLDIISNALAG